MKVSKWILAHHFEGVPKDSDVELVTEELPELKDGDVLLQAAYWSVDPYMRPYSNRVPTGTVMMGQQLARVSESKNAKYTVGDLFLVNAGWRDKIVVNPDSKDAAQLGIRPALDTGKHPSSLNLGVLGMPGVSAYIGLVRICEPKPGETVYVNSAAGIVGSVVGQIAKIMGCRVVGSAGTDEKCRWLTSELGFDYVYNYKTQDWAAALKEGAPNGIDCFFDNVGDNVSSEIIMNHMNVKGRICCCGAIAQYNSTETATGPILFQWFIFKQLKMQGFLYNSYEKDHHSMRAHLQQWVDEGKLKYREDVVLGFENLQGAFYGMLNGKYTGKVIVKAAL